MNPTGGPLLQIEHHTTAAVVYAFNPPLFSMLCGDGNDK